MLQYILGIISMITISALIFLFMYLKHKKQKEQQALKEKALNYLKIRQFEINKLFAEYNETVVVKSRQSLYNYDSVSYFKANKDAFGKIKDFIIKKSEIIEKMKNFSKDNPYIQEKEYPSLKKYLGNFIYEHPLYIIRVVYITQAGNCLATKKLFMNLSDVVRIEKTPELYMTKTELKEIDKKRLDNRKKNKYSEVNNIIDRANLLKESLINKKDDKTLDELISKLFDRTVNSIQKIKLIDSDEWTLIDRIINDVNKAVTEIEEKNIRLQNYYDSNDFEKLKKTCDLLMNSQKEFNNYIEEKVQSISKMFGTRPVRNETEHEDTYNYVRKYNKTISPFTAELSSYYFGKAENDPIQSLIKYFYPNKFLYNSQIINLKNLLNELEALKDAKLIIDNYKKDYAEYIENVPPYVLEDDEDGFYSRLGFATIDENVLNIEYKFVYTSNGGMAQRSFSIPMTEETISELINQLQDKLSTASLAKEQRALVTPKLRLRIKERDNYTCCQCGNSTHKEPNLLLEIDHIIPIAKGGLTIEQNLQTLCWKCNRNKGAKLV